MWQPHPVIELVRSRLDEGDRKRWDAALTEPPLVARRPWWTDPVLPILGATLWIVPYMLTFEPWATPPPSIELAIRAVAAAAWLTSARGALFAWRAHGAAWPSGRFLFRWGYAEIENDVLHVIPVHDLEHEIRGRFLGVGPIRLRLRSGGWSTTLTLGTDEVEQVVTALDEPDSSRIDLLPGSYRSTARPPERPRALRRLPRPARELPWALVAGVIGALVPGLGDAGDGPPELVAAESYVPRNLEGFRAPYTTALRPREGETESPDVAVQLEHCSETPVIVSSVASYLTLALTTHHLGPAHPFLPTLAPRGRAAARVWADCSWEVDQSNGTLLRAVARWGLDRDGRTVVERRATVEIDDVIRLFEAFPPDVRSSSLSPEWLAATSLLLMEGTILHDLYEDGRAVIGPERALLDARPVADAVARVAVTHVRDP